MPKTLITNIEQTIKRHKMLRAGDVVLVALSGGPDSVCLLSALEELRSLDRYMSEGEKGVALQLHELIRVKDDLDYHYSLQSLLRWWLFVHVPLTFALLIIAVTHGVLAHAFFIGVR